METTIGTLITNEDLRKELLCLHDNFAIILKELKEHRVSLIKWIFVFGISQIVVELVIVFLLIEK